MLVSQCFSHRHQDLVELLSKHRTISDNIESALNPNLGNQRRPIFLQLLILSLQFGLHSTLLENVLNLFSKFAHSAVQKLFHCKFPLFQIQLKLFRQSLVNLIPMRIR